MYIVATAIGCIHVLILVTVLLSLCGAYGDCGILVVVCSVCLQVLVLWVSGVGEITHIVTH